MIIMITIEYIKEIQSYTSFNVNLHEGLLRVGLQRRDDYPRSDLLWGVSLFHQLQI